MEPDPGTLGRRARMAGAYDAAWRHSRRVRLFRLAMPLLAALAIAVYAALVFLERRPPANVGIDASAIVDGKIVMRNPAVNGRLANGERYSLHAERAIQDLSVRNVIRLEDIVAEIAFGQAGFVLVSALEGTYDGEVQTLMLPRPFTVTTKTGMTAALRSARIDLRAGTLQSDEPVRIDTDRASVTARSLFVRDNGGTAVFDRDVRMTVRPGAIEAVRQPVSAGG